MPGAPVYVKARPNMLPDLKRLCKECFGGGEWIDLFFQYWFGDGVGRVLLEDGRPVSMLYLLPARLVTDSGRRAVHYIYAVGTQGVKRGLGYGGRLIKEAIREAGTPCLLVPAKASLFSYYEKQSFQRAFLIKETAFPAGSGAASCRIWPVSPMEYKKGRDAFFNRSGYLEWGEKAVAYAIAMNQLEGGEAALIEAEGSCGLVLYKKQEELLKVYETTFGGIFLKKGLNSFAQTLGCSRIETRVPLYSEVEGEKKEFAMCCGIEVPEAAYFNLEF